VLEHQIRHLLHVNAKGILAAAIRRELPLERRTAILALLIPLVREVVEAEGNRRQRERDHEKL
jgi:hypothetical protein